MAARQTQQPVASSASIPSREEFVREYMAQLSANKPPKVSLTTRLAEGLVRATGDVVEHSRVLFGDVRAAWEIAEDRAELAYARRHARYAEAKAIELGLK